MNTTGQQGQAGLGGTSPVAVQQTTVIHVGSQKSVAGAVILALLFGPLGMLYATVVGALVMFFVNILVAIATLGLGLILTIPIGAVWAGIAASNHNKQLGAMSTQAFGAPVPAQPVSAAASGWHDDPEGSGRLRYWDGTRWTEHYADKPGTTQDEPVPTETAPAQVSSLATEAPAIEPAPAAPGLAAEVAAQPVDAPADVAATSGKVFCGACGNEIGASDRFCAGCGTNQEEIV